MTEQIVIVLDKKHLDEMEALYPLGFIDYKNSERITAYHINHESSESVLRLNNQKIDQLFNKHHNLSTYILVFKGFTDKSFASVVISLSMYQDLQCISLENKEINTLKSVVFPQLFR